MIEIINRMGVPYFIQIIIEMWNGIFLIIMMFSLIIGKRSDYQGKTYIPFTNELIVFFAALFLYNIFDIIGCIETGDISEAGILTESMATFCYFIVGAFQTLFFLELIKKQVAEKNGMKNLRKLTFFFQLLHIPCLVLLVMTPFTQALYWYDEQNLYHRGEFYPVWYFTTIISFVFIIMVFLLLHRKMDRFLAKVIALASIIPLIAFICNYAYVSISFNNIFVSITALLIYMLYEKYRTEYAIRNVQELENVKLQLVEANNKTLMLQIQPHFITNSLTALQAKCTPYPEIYESISNFSQYLRSNFDALGDTQFITFKKEMRNINAYLALEKCNFGDRLNIETNIEFDDFYIPALTVQPLVENAVRHGVATYDKGGTIWIKTRREDGKIIIEVTDDGSGRSNITMQQKDRKGIGIDNSKARISSMAVRVLEII
ncbi:MAG: histidine kinase, partial [Firmicutes bacterium]|nr:histidine kinase [Bacillota bacterium]